VGLEAVVTPRAYLLAVRALLAQGWCQHALARDRHGERCNPAALDAACWCLRGACQRIDHEHPLAVAHHASGEAWRLLHEAAQRRGFTSWQAAMDLNDARRTRLADVLALVDDALAEVPALERAA
jgi:hypothetical protein